MTDEKKREPFVINVEGEPPMPVVLLHPEYGLIEFEPKHLDQLCAERDAELQRAMTVVEAAVVAIDNRDDTYRATVLEIKDALVASGFIDTEGNRK